MNFEEQKSPRAFAKMVFKQGDAEEESVEAELSLHRSGQQIFKQGDQPLVESADAEEFVLNKTGKQIFVEGEGDVNVSQQPNLSRPPQNRPPQRPEPAALIAAQVYNKMLVLGSLYGRLARYNTQFTPVLEDMQDELDILSFAMLRIYQTLSRGRNLPQQNFATPRFSDFCGGVNVTIAFLRGLLFDIRRLQRAVNNNNIDLQLIIINQTLLAHQQQLFEMRTDCANQ